MKPLIGSERVLGYFFSNKSGYGFRLFLCPLNIEPLDTRGAAASRYISQVILKIFSRKDSDRWDTSEFYNGL